MFISKATIKKYGLGVITLLIGGTALALGILAEHERRELNELKKPPRVVERGVTFQINKFSFSVGKEEKTDPPPKEVPKYPPFLIASWSVGIFGLMLSPVPWIKDQQRGLSCSSAALCVLGLAWHYVLIAIFIAVLLMVLGSLS